MPLADRSIQPTWLGRRKLTDEEKHEEICHIAVNHNAQIGILVQLASLVRHADDLFCDLAEECQLIFEKTESITNKVHKIERVVLQMDSTEVKIPVGTLEEFSHVKEHHVAKHGFDCNFFTPVNRPYCIKAQHSMCDVTPVHALRGIDLYRKDGLSTSILFKLWPIALKDTVIKSENMNTPNTGVEPIHPHLKHKKSYKQLKLRERPKTNDSIDAFFHEEASSSSSSSHLQNNKMEGLSKSQPSMLVAVDTSGAGFERMASFRRSASSSHDVTSYHHSLDRKRRRRTVTGIGDNTIQEIEQFEEGRRILRPGPRKYSLDNLDSTEIDAKDEMMQQFLKEIDNQRAEREELEYAAEKDKKLLKLIPCRRSKSLPRCVKLLTDSFIKSRESTRTPLYVKRRSQQRVPVDEMRLPREETTSNTTVHQFGGSNASLVSSGTGRLSRASMRSSVIGNKIRSMMSNTVKNTMKKRPKSLDFDSVGVIDEDEKKSKKKNKEGCSTERSVSMSRIGAATPTVEGVTRAASSESTIGPGSYYYFDSNTVPRAQQCKYDFPWDSLPKDWTTAVKLREITKRRKEERQSSSGNWSASGYSSNRQSLDSDAKPGPSGMPAYLASQYSIGRDSGRDSPIEEHDGLDTGYMGDAASMESISDTKSTSNTDSDDWIKSLAERAAGRGDVTSTSADALTNLSRLTKENIRNLDILVPGRSTRHRLSRMELDEDGESSVYSLDQDGFYTSFHNDSGLRRSSNNLLEEDEDLMMPRIRECKSLQSMSSSLSTSDSSALFKPCSNSTGKLDLVHTLSSSTSSSHDSNSQNTTLVLDASQPGDSDTLDGENTGIEYGETGTIKAAKKDKNKKKIPPPPPPRTSSCLKEEKTTREVSKSNNNVDNINVGDSSPTLSESSDQETIYARLKIKTRISAKAIPSLCSNILSDDEDTLPRDPLSASHERLNAEASEIEEILKGGTLPGTLPRVKKTLSLKKELEEIEYPANSWPRLKKTNKIQPQQQGILKTPEKDKGKLPSTQPKTLNFDPMVNMYDPLTPGGCGMRMPLSRLSSSDESPSSPPTNYSISTFGSPAPTALTNNKTMSVNGNGFHAGYDEDVDDLMSQKPAGISKKWDKQPSSSTPITTSSKSWIPDLNNPNPNPNHHQSSASFLENPSQDSFHGLDTDTKPLGFHDKNADLQGSTSTIALSDIDADNTSLTRVSETDSTLSGSVLSLNWDTDNTPNITPMPTPARQHRVFDKDKVTLFNDLSSPPSNLDSSSSLEGRANRDHSQKEELEDSSFMSQLPPPPKPLQLSHFSQSSPSPASPPLPPPPPPPTSAPSSPFHTTSILSFQHDQNTKVNASHVPSDDKINNNNNTTNSNYNNNNNIVLNSNYKYSSENSSSDNNNHHSYHHQHPIHSNSNSSRFKFPEPNNNNNNMPKSNSWSAEHSNNSTTNISRPKKSGVQSNSFQYNSSWSGGHSNKYQVRLSHQSRSQTHQQPPCQVVERRRSSPVDVEDFRQNQWSNSNTDNISDSSSSQRRRSGGSNLMSPTDSGFCSSPSVTSHPNSNPAHSSTPSTHYDYHRGSNRTSLSSSSSAYNHHNQIPSNSYSKVPQIKQPLLNNESSSSLKNHPNSPSVYQNNIVSNKMTASHSSDSLNSQQSSTSSSKHLITQNSNTDYVRPVLLRGSSNESLKSNSSAGRSDSYRVAQLSEYDDKTSLLSKKELLPSQPKHEERKNANSNSKYNTRPYSTSSANPPPTVPHNINRAPVPLTKSLSTPTPSSLLTSQIPAVDPEVFNRADSYRCAMQNSENVEQNSNTPGRNSSYRFATSEEDVVFNSRMDFYNNMWTGTSGSTRDSRRMGITDVDQLKSFDSNYEAENNKPNSETVHSRKKLSVKDTSPISGNKQPQSVQLRQTARSSSNPKDKMKQRSQSSSYIRFDPIFESREDIRASKESLRPPSITSIRTLTKTDSSEALTAEKAHLMSYKRAAKSPQGRRSGSQGRRSSDEKSGFLGTLKTTIKSIGAGKGDH